MIKFYVALLVSALTAHTLKAQGTDITFDINNNMLTSSLPVSKNITLPVRLLFPVSKFTDKQLRIFGDPGFKRSLGYNKRLNKSMLPVGDNNFIVIVSSKKDDEPNTVVDNLDNLSISVGDENISETSLKKVFTIDRSTASLQGSTTTSPVNQETSVALPTTKVDNGPQLSKPGSSVPGDALLLARKKPIPAESDNLKSILQAYIDPNKPSQSPILAKLFPDAFPIGGANVVEGSGGSSWLPPAVGNLDVTNIADGIAQFLIERSKEELNVAFFEKLNTYLNQYPDIKTIFPRTAGFMRDFSSYQYATMLSTLKSCFQHDLNNFAKNLLQLRELTPEGSCSENPECKQRISYLSHFLIHTLQGRGLMASVFITNQMTKKQILLKALDNLAQDKVCDTNDNLSNAIYLANLISYSIKDNNSAGQVVCRDTLEALLRNPLAVRIYLGLIQATDNKNRKVNFSGQHGAIVLSVELDSLFRMSDKNLLACPFVKKLALAGGAAVELFQLETEVAAQISQTDFDATLSYGQLAEGVAETFSGFIQTLPLTNENEKQYILNDIHAFTDNIGTATDCIAQIKNKNYGMLVVDIAHLIGNIPTKDDRFKQDFIKYGMFMANMIQAQNAADVKSLLDATVMPVGSASAKRNSYLNVCLNGYIGSYVGGEYLPALKSNALAAGFGITAPVGVAVSWGNIKFRKADFSTHNQRIGKKSFTVFVPLVDIGTIASYRISASNDSVAINSKITLKNIVSPGLFFYWGFGKVPISIGLGGQLGPQLRDINVKDNSKVDINNNLYFRFSANLVVDIPFFNLYSRTSK